MKTPKTKASKDPNKLRADGNETDRDKLLAKIAFDGTVSNAATARLFAKGSFGELDLTECVRSPTAHREAETAKAHRG